MELFDPNGPGIELAVLHNNGDVSIHYDCNPDTFEFKRGILSYESTECAMRIVYIPDVSKWSTE